MKSSKLKVHFWNVIDLVLHTKHLGKNRREQQLHGVVYLDGKHGSNKWKFYNSVKLVEKERISCK